METIRILVAHELRSYRDAMAAAIGCLRAEAEVVSAEPADLDTEIARLTPHLVLCSRLGPAVEGVPNWVVLYPGHETRAELCVGGRREAVGDLPFERLLQVVDDAAALARTAGRGMR